jgi:hypothetical protein
LSTQNGPRLHWFSKQGNDLHVFRIGIELNTKRLELSDIFINAVNLYTKTIRKRFGSLCAMCPWKPVGFLKVNTFQPSPPPFPFHVYLNFPIWDSSS